jgi:hypothetical protein
MSGCQHPLNEYELVRIKSGPCNNHCKKKKDGAAVLSRNKEKTMERIGIRFNDNDFYFTFAGVLNSFAYAYKDTCRPYEIEALTKAQITIIINELSYGMFMLQQDRFRQNNDSWDPKKYLTIKEDQIYLDEEIDDFQQELGDGWYNGEFYWVDLGTGEVDSF